MYDLFLEYLPPYSMEFVQKKKKKKKKAQSTRKIKLFLVV